jgi:hypothetical protein
LEEAFSSFQLNRGSLVFSVQIEKYFQVNHWDVELYERIILLASRSNRVALPILCKNKVQLNGIYITRSILPENLRCACVLIAPIKIQIILYSVLLSKYSRVRVRVRVIVCVREYRVFSAPGLRWHLQNSTQKSQLTLEIICTVKEIS